METLNNAARAAGFAMAGTDELYEEPKPAATPVGEDWQSAGAVTPQDLSISVRQHRGLDWFRSLFALFGRRAPASPA
jgi:hypothetical protein